MHELESGKADVFEIATRTPFAFRDNEAAPPGAECKWDLARGIGRFTCSGPLRPSFSLALDKNLSNTIATRPICQMPFHHHFIFQHSSPQPCFSTLPSVPTLRERWVPIYTFGGYSYFWRPLFSQQYRRLFIDIRV